MSREGLRLRMDSIQTHGELLHSEPLLELQHIDDAAAMGAIADLAVAVPGPDLEQHALAVDLDHARIGADRAANRSCARWRIFTSMPTLTKPSGRCEAMAEPDAISI